MKRRLKMLLKMVRVVVRVLRLVQCGGWCGSVPVPGGARRAAPAPH